MKYHSRDDENFYLLSQDRDRQSENPQCADTVHANLVLPHTIDDHGDPCFPLLLCGRAQPLQ